MVDAVSIVIDKISTLLLEEAAFLSNVKDDFERLHLESKRMLSFLKDADQIQDQNERVRVWVDQIRDIAYDTEDIIDKFILKIPTGEPRFCGFTSLSILTKGFLLHDIGNQIVSIRSKIGDIYGSMHMAGIKFDGESESSNSLTETRRRRLRRSYPDEDDEQVIRLESTMSEVVGQLMKEEDKLCVVSIVGMGGLGKTTLAKLVFNRIDVKKHFDCSSWVFLSQQFSPTDVFLEILTEIGGKWQREKWEKMKEEELMKAVKDKLKLKRYLVVIDDIWNEASWDSLKGGFPNGKRGSKILLTSRIKAVALYADQLSYPVEPPFLTTKEGWKLLRKKAFPQGSSDKQSCDHQFRAIGKEMVKKCGGLPLAIVVLGGLLANKSIKEWEKVQGDINVHFKKLQQRSPYAGVEWILGLSYHDLPFLLKPCFLYLSHYPEDYEFHKKKLIRMWIAEGFIPEPMDESIEETTEDVGEQYLQELVNRCMVQVSERDYTGIGIKTCRMHDLMRDMCVSKARDENFLRVIGKYGEIGAANNATMHLTSSKTRRIAFHYDESFMAGLEKCGSGLRSFLSFAELKIDIGFTLKNYKFLRVLNVEDPFAARVQLLGSYRGHLLPRQFGNLIHLRYLGIGMIKVPAFIGNLRSLYTLDLRQPSHGLRLPDVLWKLQSLRHLLLHKFVISGDFRLDTLRHLETLKWVDAKNLIRNDGVLKLRNLRHLAIKFDRGEEVDAVLSSPIFHSGGLRSLKMMLKSERVCFSNLEPLSACYNLTKLSLDGVLTEEESECNLRFLPESLVKLGLRNSTLKQDPIGVLEKLPNLRILSLAYNAYEGSEMVCSSCGFCELEILQLEYLGNLQEWVVEKGAMPSLKSLKLCSLKKLKMIPNGLKFVSTLRNLELGSMNPEFEKRVKVIGRVEGEDVHKVRHIPTVTIIGN